MQIYEIFQLLPQKLQVGVFSATMPFEVLEIARKFMKEPVRILVERDGLTLEGIKQFYVDVHEEELKLHAVCNFYKTLAIPQSVIFVNTRRKVIWLTDKMHARGHTVAAIHGDMDQEAQNAIRHELKLPSGVLITTELLAHEVDAEHVSLVINYDLPAHPENYADRLVRKGMARRKGVAINFVTNEDRRLLQDIEKVYNVAIEELPSNVADWLPSLFSLGSP